NPLAWQLLFVIGAILGSSPHGGAFPVPRRRSLVVLAAAYAVFAFVVTMMDWQYGVNDSLFPRELRALLFPIMDRTNLSLWRLTHLLALAYITAYFLRANTPWLRWRVMRPLILCGQHSLEIFCLGVLLSIAGWIVLAEVDGSLPFQFLVNASGVATMTAVAFLLSLASPPEATAGHISRVE
ncbi:MAG TPA: OpgC domain-containing protein, partial [Dehalococcoidia bacterium]|nr:OpgC domain-containing protein [Dehalococcoidia bacterium]